MQSDDINTNESSTKLQNQNKTEYIITSRCYCQSKLQEYDGPIQDVEVPCRHCWRFMSKDERFYICMRDEEKCIYFMVMSMQYYVCVNCFAKNTYNRDAQQNRNTFMHQKFQSTLNAIS